MIKVTVWNEYVQEQMGLKTFPFMEKWEVPEHIAKEIEEKSKVIRELHNGAIHNTLKTMLEEEEDIQVCHIATLEMDECGLTEEVLKDTDVLVWWSHIAQDQVPDEIAERVHQHVLKGMGMIFLHSAHMSRPMQKILGTSGTLRWREGDFCRVWNTKPTHPIAKGIPEYFELEEEEMYGEYFDIPTPEDQVFLSWYRGGELFRSGCTWTRGYGRIFYFQPGHETNPSYFNQYVRQIIKNAVRWSAEPGIRMDKLECIHAEEIPEKKVAAEK